MKYTLKPKQIELQQILKECNKCLVHKSVRSGKTLALLDFCKNYKVLWVTIDLKNKINIYEEIKKFNIKINIEVICYQSFKKYENSDTFDIIVFDECQKLTIKHKKILDTISCSKIIAMTGTIPNKREKIELYNSIGFEKVFSYTTEEAINDNVIANYKIIFKHIPLNEKKDIKVLLKNDKFFYTSEVANYKYLTDRISIELNNMKKKILSIIRTRLLNSSINKINYVKEYIEKNHDKRVLIFAPTIEIAKQISKYNYSSKTNTKYLDLFHKNKINHLVLVEKASTGETYYNLDGCLLMTLNNDNVGFEQKIGRSLLFREDYTSNIIVLYTRQTVQETQLINATKNIDKNKICEE